MPETSEQRIFRSLFSAWSVFSHQGKYGEKRSGQPPGLTAFLILNASDLITRKTAGRILLRKAFV